MSGNEVKGIVQIIWGGVEWGTYLSIVSVTPTVDGPQPGKTIVIETKQWTAVDGMTATCILST